MISITDTPGGMMAFAENLRRLRLERFLSQGELARRAGLHAVTLTRLEAGSTAPSTRTVRALAEALGVEPRALATPNEVAELRRVLRRAAPTERTDSHHPATWSDDGGGVPSEDGDGVERASSGADDRR
jgi:transcriptional regulator with XRE-family HTH domain